VSAVASPFRLPAHLCENCGLRYDRAFSHPTLGPVCPICVRPIKLQLGAEPYVAMERPRPQPQPRPRRSKTAATTARKIRQLAERDGWTCHLCGEPINPGKRTGHQRATLDHLTPRSLGGRNGIENLKLAHAICNSKRGNQPLQPKEA
jgi:hypothetical protein